MNAIPTIWTVGHSTRSADAFAAVLHANGVELIADVRRFPGSRRHPQFGADALEKKLAAEGIGYAWLSKFGGRRRGESGPAQAGWRNPSFRAYAGYTSPARILRGELAYPAGDACCRPT